MGEPLTAEELEEKERLLEEVNSFPPTLQTRLSCGHFLTCYLANIGIFIMEPERF